MAILKNGILGPANGRISNLVTYKLNDQEIVRSIGVNKKNTNGKTIEQQAANESNYGLFSVYRQLNSNRL